MSIVLFNREVTLNAGGIQVATRLENGKYSQPLRITFQVTKTRKKSPNKCEISIFNLSEEHRASLQKSSQLVELEAGYLGSTSKIFQGELQYAKSFHDGNTWVTTMQAADGKSAYRGARINKSFSGKVSLTDALKEVATAMGISKGNLDKAIAAGSKRKNLGAFENGIVLSGKAEMEMDKITKAMGISWSIQDGQLSFLSPKGFLGDTATLLSPATGLIGSPEPGEKGKIELDCLIQARIMPGHRVKVESNQVTGFYRVEQTDINGDTHGPWDAALECSPL